MRTPAPPSASRVAAETRPQGPSRAQWWAAYPHQQVLAIPVTIYGEVKMKERVCGFRKETKLTGTKSVHQHLTGQDARGSGRVLPLLKRCSSLLCCWVRPKPTRPTRPCVVWTPSPPGPDHPLIPTSALPHWPLPRPPTWQAHPGISVWRTFCLDADPTRHLVKALISFQFCPRTFSLKKPTLTSNLKLRP